MISTPRRTSPETIRNQAPPAVTAGHPYPRTHPQPLRLNSYGHHGYIRSRRVVRALFEPGRPEPVVGEAERAAIERVSAVVPEVAPRMLAGLPAWFDDVPREERRLALELLTRMVASAVYDADVLDTRQFAEQAQAPALYPGPDLAELAEVFEKRRAREVGGRVSAVAAAREELAGLARDAAAGAPGFVRC